MSNIFPWCINMAPLKAYFTLLSLIVLWDVPSRVCNFHTEVHFICSLHTRNWAGPHMVIFPHVAFARCSIDQSAVVFNSVVQPLLDTVADPVGLLTLFGEMQLSCIQRFYPFCFIYLFQVKTTDVILQLGCLNYPSMTTTLLPTIAWKLSSRGSTCV